MAGVGRMKLKSVGVGAGVESGLFSFKPPHYLSDFPSMITADLLTHKERQGFIFMSLNASGIYSLEDISRWS